MSMEKAKPVKPENDLNDSLFASPPVHLEARGGDIGKIVHTCAFSSNSLH